MNGYEFPVVRITLQGMEQTVNHAMSGHLAKMDSDCQKAVKAAVESFDYAGEVRAMAQQMIRDAIKRALEKEILYGQTYTAIEKVAQEMIRKQVKAFSDE
jgi:stress-induced morphogen